ncbi:hypothetical protein TcCL_NonESM03424, partial [Trypanosoma cruzi]
THHTKQHALATQLRAQRQTFRQSEAGGVPPQRRKPQQARRPPASPPVVCFPSAKAAPTLCSLLQENTSRGKKVQLRRQQAGAVCHWRCPARSAHRRRGERHGTHSPHTESHTTGTDSKSHRGTLRSQINHTKTKEYIPSGSKPHAPTAR